MNINNGKTGIIDIPGALHSTGGDGDGQIGGVVAYTGDIWDVNLNRNQADINENMLVLDEDHNLLINKDFINVEGRDNLLRGGDILGYTLSGSNSQYELKLWGENWYQNNLGYQFVKFLEGSKILDELTPVATITTDVDLGELDGEYFNTYNQNIASHSFCSGIFLNKGGYSTLIGNDNYNTGYGNISIGDNNINNGEQTVLIGRVNAVKSDTDQCYILGEGNKVNGNSNLYSIGCINTSTGNNLYSFAFGSDVEFTRGSTTGNDWITQVGIGEFLNISQNEFVIGQNNKDYDTADSSKRNFFVVGNGTADNARSNSLEQKANGDLYIKGIGNFDGTNSNVDTTKSLQSKINDLQTQIDNVNVSNFYTKSEIDAQNVVTSTALNDLNDSVSSKLSLDSNNNLIINPKSEVESTATDSLIGGIATVGKGEYAFGFGGNALKVYISGNASDGYQLQANVTSSFDPTNFIRPIFENIYKNTYLLDANTYEKVAKITAVTPNTDGQKISITLDTDLGTLTNTLYRLENISKNKSFNFGVFGNIGDWSSILGYGSYNTGNYSNVIGSNNYNSKTYSTLLGTQNVNAGNYSTLIGYDNKVTAGNYPFAIGIQNIINNNGYIVGRKNVIGSNNTLGYIFGYDNYCNTNKGAYLFGQKLVCENSRGGFLIGQYNKEYITNDASIANWFAVGCGDQNSPRQNGIEIKQNLDTYVYGVGGFTGDNSDSSSVKPINTVISELQNTITSLQSRITALENQLNGNNA